MAEETKDSHNNAASEQLPEEPAVSGGSWLFSDRDF